MSGGLFNNSILDAYSSNLKAAWRLDEASGNIIDMLNGYIGTASGTPVYGLSGKDKSCINFNRAGHFTTNWSGILGTNARSISFWMMSNLSSGYAEVVSWGKRDGINDQSMRVYLNSAGDLTVSRWLQSSYIYVTPSLNDGVWHHILITFPSSANIYDGKIYVDGTAPTLYGYNNQAINTTSDKNLRIGCRHDDDSGRRWDDKLDEIYFWQDELSADAAEVLNNDGQGIFLEPYEDTESTITFVQLTEEGVIPTFPESLVTFANDIIANIHSPDSESLITFLNEATTKLLQYNYNGYAVVTFINNVIATINKKFSNDIVFSNSVTLSKTSNIAMNNNIIFSNEIVKEGILNYIEPGISRQAYMIFDIAALSSVRFNNNVDTIT